ncbi:RNA methyltransferase [Gammaproteobacteria bacterium]|nr:RNA methyltransferase [Gammaproteobacteria bacterium]
MIEFSKVKIVLLETSHPGNIGSAARAMKTMGFSILYLVNPKCEINEISYAMASHAGDILDNAQVSNNLSEVLGNCNYIVGATARQRDIPIEVLNPREIANKINADSYDEVAILLGNEARGLTNEQLSLCSVGLHIPSNKEYTSLNLASSLQIILYEILFKSEIDSSYINKIDKKDIASNEKLSGFLNHMNKVLKEIDFIKDDRPMIVRKIDHIFKKASLSEEEINILRGILSAIENHSQ